MREISANNTEFRAAGIGSRDISYTYAGHELRSICSVLSATACQLSDLANALRSLVHDHAKEFLGRARFCDGAQYHRELIRAAPEFSLASQPFRAAPGGALGSFADFPDGFELWLLSWLPGQVTPIHDHGGVLTATTVLSGAVLEERFERTHASQVRPTWTTLREVGDLDPIEPATIHRVRPIGSAVTLHLYVPLCVEGRIYELAPGDRSAPAAPA